MGEFFHNVGLPSRQRDKKTEKLGKSKQMNEAIFKAHVTQSIVDALREDLFSWRFKQGKYSPPCAMLDT